MVNCHFNKLLATSFMVLMLGGSSIQSTQTSSGNQAPVDYMPRPDTLSKGLKVPEDVNNRKSLVDAYSMLKMRAIKGDQAASTAMKAANIPTPLPLDLSPYADTIIGMIQNYNQLVNQPVSQTPTVPSRRPMMPRTAGQSSATIQPRIPGRALPGRPIPTPQEVSSTAMPTEGGGVSSELPGSVPQESSSVPMLPEGEHGLPKSHLSAEKLALRVEEETERASKYRVLANQCIAGHDVEKKKYEEKIKILEEELKQAKLCPESGGKVSTEQQKIYDELDNFLQTDPMLQYKKIKELLESLLAQNDSDSAITTFLSIVNKHQGDGDRGEKINNIYIRLNEEGILKEYFLSVMRKELQVTQRSIYSEGDKVLEGLAPHPDLNLLIQNPLLMICYTDKDKAKGFWITNNLKIYNEFILSTKQEYLKAVYTFLTKKWKVRHPLDVVTTTPMEAFLISIYNQIESGKAPNPRSLKMSKPDVQRFIEDRMKTDLPINYQSLEQENLKFENEFNAVSHNIQAEIARNPFLKILEVESFSQWSKLGFERASYDKMVSFLPYCTLHELKAVLYKLSKIGFTTSGDLNEQYFYKAVNEQVKTREAHKETKALQGITGPTKTEMNSVVSKIISEKPDTSGEMKKGTRPAPPRKKI